MHPYLWYTPPMDTSIATVAAPAPLTNKWPTKLTRTVLLGLNIHNNHDLTKPREPMIWWRVSGPRMVVPASWMLSIRGAKFKSAAWYDYGSLTFTPMRGGREDKQAKLLEAIYKADALGLCAPHQWVKTPWGDYVPVAACRRAWERAFPGKVFPLDTVTATVVKGGR